MQTPEIVENILSHHGVKGMRWGVRRKATVGAQEVVVSDKRKKLKTSGGKGFPAHSDAIRARKIGQVGKKSGIKALSDADLQAYNRRLNLEQQAKRLAFQDLSVGRRFVQTMLGRGVKSGVESGTREVLNSARARRLKAVGASAMALA